MDPGFLMWHRMDYVVHNADYIGVCTNSPCPASPILRNPMTFFTPSHSYLLHSGKAAAPPLSPTPSAPHTFQMLLPMPPFLSKLRSCTPLQLLLTT